MAKYKGWTEVREYRVWQADDMYACTTVLKHKNGWYQVDTDGYDVPYKTRSENDAFTVALQRAETCAEEAKNTCPCHRWAEVEQVECYSPELNPYNAPHGVRTQVVDVQENREIDSWNL